MVQTSVTTQPAPAVAGDFASGNPFFTVDAGPGGLVAGPAGVTVGRFAWTSPSPADPNGANSVVNNSAPPTGGAPTGFVHRNQQALITQFLGSASQVIQQGMSMALMSGGDFWVKNEGAAQVLPGMNVFASLLNGAATAFASGTAISSASVTASIAAVSVTGIVGYISGNILTVTGSGTSLLVPGAQLSGTFGGASVASSTEVIAQLTGSLGQVGTYSLSIPEQTIGSSGSTATFSATYGVMTVTALASGSIAVGGSVGGTGVSASTVLTGFGTGTGGNGTYYVNNTQTVGSGSMTIGSNVATKWYATSSALPGELFKMTAYVGGASI